MQIVAYHVGFEATATISTNLIWVLPQQMVPNTQVLTTDGSGNLSWTDGGGGGGAHTGRPPMMLQFPQKQTI